MWLIEHMPTFVPVPLSISAVDSIKEFRQKNKLQKLALNMIAHFVEDDKALPAVGLFPSQMSMLLDSAKQVLPVNGDSFLFVSFLKAPPRKTKEHGANFILLLSPRLGTEKETRKRKRERESSTKTWLRIK